MAKASLLMDSELYLPKTAILTSTEAARAMGFASTEALSRARLAGRLPIAMFRVPGRRGWFAATRDVKAWLESLLHARTGHVEPVNALAREKLDG